MKKLALLVMTLFALASCSNDEYSDTTHDTKIQKVDLTIASNSFKVTETPLRSNPVKGLLQYVFYQENGDVFLNQVIYPEDLAEFISDNKAVISVDLPEGKYHVAILSTYNSTSNPTAYIIKPLNYNTDYYLKTSMTYMDSNNLGTYYETFDLVVDDNITVQDIELKPMWSVIEFVIENAKTFTVPAETMQVAVALENYYDGFYIKSKQSRKGTPSLAHPNVMELSKIRQGDTVKYRLFTTVTEDKDINLEVSYMKDEATTIISTKKIITFQPENGKNYLISGNLPNQGESQSMYITLGDLDDEVIELPF